MEFFTLVKIIFAGIGILVVLLISLPFILVSSDCSSKSVKGQTISFIVFEIDGIFLMQLIIFKPSSFNRWALAIELNSIEMIKKLICNDHFVYVYITFLICILFIRLSDVLIIGILNKPKMTFSQEYSF